MLELRFEFPLTLATFTVNIVVKFGPGTISCKSNMLFNYPS